MGGSHAEPLGEVTSLGLTGPATAGRPRQGLHTLVMPVKPWKTPGGNLGITQECDFSVRMELTFRCQRFDRSLTQGHSLSPSQDSRPE